MDDPSYPITGYSASPSSVWTLQIIFGNITNLSEVSKYSTDNGNYLSISLIFIRPAIDPTLQMNFSKKSSMAFSTEPRGFYH